MKTYFVANFGCRAAQSEGAAIGEEIGLSGAQPAADAITADVVIVNSCTITEEADRQVRQLVRRAARRNPNSRIIVTGCYAQRDPEALAGLPNVRYVVGNSHKARVGAIAVDLLDEALSTQGRAEVLCSSIFLETELKPQSHFGSGGRTRAIVKVQDGCNANCSFCIIPSVRGRSRSLEPAAVLAEVRDLVNRGYKEIVFSGIHLGTYGRDLEASLSFQELIESTLEIPGLERLRLSSIEPLEVTPGLIELVATNPRMAHHFHVPLQSGSARVLRAMRRPYSPSAYLDLLRRIRAAIPDAAIGADVMVGFPGETDQEFEATYQLVESSPLTYLHVFPFSSRPGTPAAEMPDPVPEHVARHRARRLRELIARKNDEFRSSLLGSEVDVLVLEDECEGPTRAALSSNFIRVRTPAHLEPNAWHRVRIECLTGDGVAC